MICSVPTTAWSPPFLLSTSFIFCVDYTQPVPSVRQWETQDVLVSAEWFLLPPPASAFLHMSPHVSLPVCPLESPAPSVCCSLSAFEHRCHEQLCFRFWGVMGCFLQQCERHGPSCDQHGQLFTFAHTGQPCSSSPPKTLQVFPRKTAAKKEKSYDRHTVDG